MVKNTLYRKLRDVLHDYLHPTVYLHILLYLSLRWVSVGCYILLQTRDSYIWEKYHFDGWCHLGGLDSSHRPNKASGVIQLIHCYDWTDWGFPGIHDGINKQTQIESDSIFVWWGVGSPIILVYADAIMLRNNFSRQMSKIICFHCITKKVFCRIISVRLYVLENESSDALPPNRSSKYLVENRLEYTWENKRPTDKGFS